jgi:hypothetical protein
MITESPRHGTAMTKVMAMATASASPARLSRTHRFPPGSLVMPGFLLLVPRLGAPGRTLTRTACLLPVLISWARDTVLTARQAMAARRQDYCDSLIEEVKPP